MEFFLSKLQAYNYSLQSCVFLKFRKFCKIRSTVASFFAEAGANRLTTE